MPRERTLERRLFGWILGLMLVPALAILAAGGWALATSLDIAGALGPWEEVAASGRQVVQLADPVADSTLAVALDDHRAALSASLTQARRWAFLGQRFLEVLPFLVIGVGLALAALAFIASRELARQLTRPIRALVDAAERLGREEPLPAPLGRTVREVRVLDDTLRQAAGQLADARRRALSAERVRVWGEMARRVAHEMKNPLTPLRFAVHRLKGAGAGAGAGARAGVDGDAGVAEAVEVIGQELTRLEELAAQFGALGRPPEGPATEVDLRELVLSLLETDVAAAVEARLHAPDAVPPVVGHYDALLRAFRNLIRNAQESMESTAAPRLDITLEVTESEPEGRRWLDARIADNGAGLPPGPPERIFEPDFTTKKRGTGLGLALVRQAIEAHGGRIAARQREVGAEFIVRIPLEGSPIAPSDERKQHATPRG